MLCCRRGSPCRPRHRLILSRAPLWVRTSACATSVGLATACANRTFRPSPRRIIEDLVPHLVLTARGGLLVSEADDQAECPFARPMKFKGGRRRLSEFGVISGNRLVAEVS